jgi:uncharacterized protein YndB with AHSA1/START domain
MAPHAAIELSVGGTMKTRYDSAGTVDDAQAIENAILSFEPLHMLSFQVKRAPADFPFPNAITKMWTILYFDARGKDKTVVTCVGLGFGSDPESTRMREFFQRGNALTLDALQKRFATTAGRSRNIR